jgi:hypothetical protein
LPGRSASTIPPPTTRAWKLTRRRRRPLRKRPTRRFAFDDKYDFGYRPATYWEELPGDRTLLAKIRGTARRRIAERALDGEQLPRLCGEELYREAIEFVLAEELTAEKRGSWDGSIR